MTFEERTAAYRAYLERFLQEKSHAFDGEPQSRLFEAMRYSLLAGGKRLRPILTMEFCRMCGGDWKDAVPFAAAVEMVHTYSLIHDDLPCMDNDDYRRGRLTNHKVYGEAMAVLAGDALLTDAFSMLASIAIPGVDLATAVGVLSECAGSHGMVGGQVLDMLSEERACTEQEILDIQTRKTGALLNAACALGVLAGKGTEAQMQAACGFAALIGLAFQIRDDMLDVIGSAEVLGKATGVDDGKNTFVRLYGLDACAARIQRDTDLAIAQLAVFPDASYLTELARRLTVRIA